MSSPLFSSVSFACFKIITIRFYWSWNILCIPKIKNCFPSCNFKICKMWHQFDNINYICTGGILLDENSNTGKGNCSVSFNNWLERYYNKLPKISDTCSMQSTTLTARYREERDLKLLQEVRFNETVETSEKASFELTNERTATLKIMSYNVLSQTLLEEHSYLYRNTSPVTLKWEYRYPRLLGEILNHNPDILCLQEVQEDHIDAFFNKLEDLGFVGVYKKRTGGKIDGCSIYYKAYLFSLVSESKVEYFKPGVKQLNRDNVGLVLRLFWWAGNRHITVANTHLLYNPKRTDVKLAQISVLLSHLNLHTDYGRNNDLVFLTGDLNSPPESSVVDLILKGFVSDPFYRAYSLPSEKNTFNYEDRDKNESPSANLQGHNFNFKSAYSFCKNGENEATTFQDRWLTADYIFYSSNNQDLSLSSRLRLPTSKECRKYIKKLPNYVSPSDHLPLVATFLFGIN